MKRILAAIAVLAALCSGAVAQDVNCGAKGPNPKGGEIKLISWNIQELATAVKVFDRAIRSEDQFKDLQLYRDCNAGDVYGLQEIASLRALGRVFPPSEFILCISGQTIADQRGLAPDYPREQLGGITPQCVTDASIPVSALPGELTTPARQYTALAIRRGSGVTLGERKDIVDLGPKDPVENRQTRWGLDVTLNKGGASLRLLVVHMKSGCTEGPVEEPSSNDNCPALSRQLQPLKSWIAQANQSGLPVFVVGDFNRRLDRESPDVKPTDVWDVITGASTASNADDVQLARTPMNKEFKCWPIQPAPERFAIDFFVYNEKARAIADADSFWKWRYGKDVEANTPRERWPSDHCPIQLNIKLP